MDERIGLNQGTSGNISARHDGRMLITPSAIPYNSMKAEMIAAMPLEGEYGSWDGPLKPSSEWRFHLDIMRARPDVGSIVHTHSTYATVLAIARKSIPACHYMIAAFGGNDIRCAGYARYGTKELSEFALAALDQRNGCLLANHGMIAVGANLDKAMWLAVELETIARQYYLVACTRPTLHSERNGDRRDREGIYDLWLAGRAAAAGATGFNQACLARGDETKGRAIACGRRHGGSSARKREASSIDISWS